MKKILITLILTIIVNAKDRVVLDNDTGLMWEDRTSITKKIWSEANNYCKNLTLAGYTNWNLPHIDELMSISDKSRYNPAIKNIFKHTKSSYYWSSTKYNGSTTQAWVVHFYNGNDNWLNKTNSYFVRCVR